MKGQLQKSLSAEKKRPLFVVVLFGLFIMFFLNAAFIFGTFMLLFVCLFVCLIAFFASNQNFFSYVGTSTKVPGLNQYKARINVSCSRTQRSDAGEARTCGVSFSNQALYQSHCAPLYLIF